MKWGQALPPVLGLGVATAAWAVRGRSSSVFGTSYWRGLPGRKAIALTFDDGPSPGTLPLLRFLEEYRVPATFFQVGENAVSYPEIGAAVRGAGHEIGNHTYSHPNLALTRPTAIRDEFARAQEALAGIPTLLRAPYGVRWFGFGAVQRELGLTGVMWSVIGRDWKMPAGSVARRVLSRARDGDIICLHDGRGTLKDPNVEPTVEAVRRIVPELLERGYHFETVTQLLWPMKSAGRT